MICYSEFFKDFTMFKNPWDRFCLKDRSLNMAGSLDFNDIFLTNIFL